MSRAAAAAAVPGWQVFDLQPVRAEVTEHQLVERECGCGHRTKAAAPAGAEGPVQYGPRIAAVIVYLYAGQFLSKDRTAVALAELFGIPCSSGTVAALTARAAGRLDGFLDHVRGQIAVSDVAGFDETGLRVAGRLAWVHCARTGKYTLLTVHAKRGRQAMEAMGILPRFGGVAVHDAWAPYDTYTAPDHQPPDSFRTARAMASPSTGIRYYRRSLPSIWRIRTKIHQKRVVLRPDGSDPYSQRHEARANASRNVPPTPVDLRAAIWADVTRHASFTSGRVCDLAACFHWSRANEPS